MKLIHSLYERRSKIQKPDCIKLLAVILVSGILSCTAHHQAKGLPDYESFVQSYSKTAPQIAEIYGQYSAEQSGKRVRSNFNLLLEPGNRAYIEILDPSDRLVHAMSLTRNHICLLWPADQSYVQEEATPENIKAIIGLPVNPDDALQLIAGRGLNFSEWRQTKILKDGWDLMRGTFSGKITAKENLSKIETITSGGTFFTFYDGYQFLDNQSRPTRIRFEVPDRKISLELRVNKYIPRTEELTADLFDLKLSSNSRKLNLHEIYHGKPLLLD
jgi:hypothetical protein